MPATSVGAQRILVSGGHPGNEGLEGKQHPVHQLELLQHPINLFQLLQHPVHQFQLL